MGAMQKRYKEIRVGSILNFDYAELLQCGGM